MNKKIIILNACLLAQQIYGMKGWERGESSAMGAQRDESSRTGRGSAELTREEQRNFDQHEVERKGLNFPSIIYAAGVGNLAVVEKWLDGTIRSRLSPKELLLLKDQKGGTALTWSASKGQAGVVKFLLDAAEKAEILPVVLQAQDKDGETALTWSASNGHPAVVKLLLDGAEKAGILPAVLQANNKDGATALIWSAGKGHAAVVKLLLDAAVKAEILKEVLQAQNKDGSTALIWAAGKGNEAVVKLLLDAAKKTGILPALLQAHNEDGETALTWSASKGHEAVVKLLLDAARDVEILPALLQAHNKDGATALTWSAGNGHAAVVKLLLDAAEKAGILKEVLRAQKKDGATALTWSAGNGHAAVVNRLLDAVSTLNQKSDQWNIVAKANEENMTTLIIACIGGDVAIVRSILKAADTYKPNQEALTAFINAQDIIKRRTVIEWAIRFAEGAVRKEKQQHNPETIKAIIDAILKYPSIDLYLRDSEGRTAIYWATYLGLDNVLRAFDSYLQKGHISMETFNDEFEAARQRHQRVDPSSFRKRPLESSDDY